LEIRVRWGRGIPRLPGRDLEQSAHTVQELLLQQILGELPVRQAAFVRIARTDQRFHRIAWIIQDEIEFLPRRNEYDHGEGEELRRNSTIDPRDTISDPRFGTTLFLPTFALRWEQFEPRWRIAYGGVAQPLELALGWARSEAPRSISVVIGHAVHSAGTRRIDRAPRLPANLGEMPGLVSDSRTVLGAPTRWLGTLDATIGRDDPLLEPRQLGRRLEQQPAVATRELELDETGRGVRVSLEAVAPHSALARSWMEGALSHAISPEHGLLDQPLVTTRSLTAGARAD
jgi:hypothetical protein